MLFISHSAKSLESAWTDGFQTKDHLFNIQHSISEASRLLHGGWLNVTHAQSSRVVHHLRDLIAIAAKIRKLTGNIASAFPEVFKSWATIYMELQRTLYQYLISSEWQIAWLYWEPNCSGKQPVSIIWSWRNCILPHFEANLIGRHVVVQPWKRTYAGKTSNVVKCHKCQNENTSGEISLQYWTQP